MQVTEFEVRDHLFEEGYLKPEYKDFKPHVEIIEKEFEICGKRIDLLGIDDELNLYVIEIKKGVIDGNAYVQAFSYMKLIKNYFNFIGKEINGLYGILVGSGIDDRTTNCVSDSKTMSFIKFELDLKLNESLYSPSEEYYTEYVKNNKALLELFNDKEQEINDVNEHLEKQGD